MQFIYSEPQSEIERLIGGGYYFNLVGTVEPGDGELFAKTIECVSPPRRLTNIYLDSSGGDVDASLAIGRLIREHDFSTYVGQCLLEIGTSDSEVVRHRKFVAGKCFSAATLIFLGGRLRHFPADAKFGVHQFSFKDPSPRNVGLSQVLSARIAKYVVDMGVAAEFIEIASSVSPSEIELLSAEKLRTFGIVTGGETTSLWSVQARGDLLYVRGERDSIYGHHKVMLCHAKNSGFMFMAFVEAQGHEHELTTFGLVEITIDGEKQIIDISDRSSRVVSGAYVVVSCGLSEDEARAIAYARDIGLRVRVWTESPVFLGIAGMSTRGGENELLTFFNHFAGG